MGGIQGKDSARAGVARGMNRVKVKKRECEPTVDGHSSNINPSSPKGASRRISREGGKCDRESSVIANQVFQSIVLPSWRQIEVEPIKMTDLRAADNPLTRVERTVSSWSSGTTST
jgi:hypothetical protein